jgi:hypothetical protein
MPEVLSALPHRQRERHEEVCVPPGKYRMHESIPVLQRHL